MRRAVELDADTEQAIEALRRERGLGVSEVSDLELRANLIPDLSWLRSASSMCCRW